MRAFASLCATLALALAAAPAGSLPSEPEGQDEADYHAWLARDPAVRAQVIAFRTHLELQGAADVVPTWQLVRTASMWRECEGPRFEVAPFTEWAHIVRTLRFVRAHVVPVIGEVQAVSGFRNEGLNQCSGGAKESAHRHFYAIDMVPVRPISREAMIRSLCRIHAWRGAEYSTGLGFYSGLRFHVDSKGFRKWGPDGKGATSPCNA
jgi:hypothetical protein